MNYWFYFPKAAHFFSHHLLLVIVENVMISEPFVLYRILSKPKLILDKLIFMGLELKDFLQNFRDILQRILDRWA